MVSILNEIQSIIFISCILYTKLFQVRKINNDELSMLAFREVKKMILSNRLKPGAKIVQEKLAGELGISRTPLRSALQMLEAEHLVNSIPRRGVYVKILTDQEIIDLFDCRIALECQAIKLLSARAKDLVIQEMRDLFSPYLMQDGAISHQSYQRADSKFHKNIIDHCGNPFLKKLYDQSNLLIFIDRIGLLRPPEVTLPEHFAIIRALEAGDGVAASLHLRTHLERSQKMLSQNQN